MQLNKNIKIFINYFLGPVLFVWLAYSIYHHINRQPQLEASWQEIKNAFYSYKILYLAGALLLVPVNWGIESWKWKISVDPTYPVSFSRAFRAVLTGVSVSVTMPNRIGEYIGRILYLPEGNRLRIISVTIVGSMAQLLVTLFAGIAGLILLRQEMNTGIPGIRLWYQFILYGLILSGFILLMVYFNVSSVVNFFRQWIRSEKYIYLVEALRQLNRELLLRLIFLSLVRYFVFFIQYSLLFNLFGVEVDLFTLMAVMSVVFLAMSVIPSIALVEIGLRNEISIQLVGLFSANMLGISLTSISVWFINLILPAIAGSLLVWNLRIFNKKNEKL